jgi:hypothetical protein
LKKFKKQLELQKSLQLNNEAKYAESEQKWQDEITSLNLQV